MENILNVLVTGDFCLRGEAAEKCNSEEFIKKISAPIKKMTSQSDISMINVETVFSDRGEPIIKSGPNLISPVSGLSLLKEMGFTIAACANNHIGDYGDDAVIDTINNLKSIGMMTVGAGKNEEDASKILYIDKNGTKLAVINACENEFGIAEKDKAGAAAFDYYKTSHLIKEANENADFVLVFIHGGNEFNPVPRPGMKKLCRFFAESGASCVIVAHSHCPQGCEVYNDVPIVYGTGNFYMSNATYMKMWERGYAVELEFKKGSPAKIKNLHPYIQAIDGSFFNFLEGEEKEYALKYIDCISKLMNSEEHYEKLTLAWADLYMRGKTEIIDNRDNAPDSEHILFVRNSYTCESHNELMTTYYKAYCDNKIFGLEKYEEMILKLQDAQIVEI